MNWVKLTLTHTDKPIYVNPENITLFYTGRDGCTFIETTQCRSEDEASHIGETLEHVLQLFGAGTEPQVDPEYEAKLADMGLHGENAQAMSDPLPLLDGTIRGKA